MAASTKKKPRVKTTAKSSAKKLDGDPAQVKKGAEVVSVNIRPLNLGKLTVKIRGTSPLVTQQMSIKTRNEITEKQTRAGGSKLKNAPRCPTEEFLGSFYVVKGDVPSPTVSKDTGEKKYDPRKVAQFLKSGVFGIPAVSFKNALISACRNADYRMTEMRQTISYVRGLGTDPNYCIIDSDSPPTLDSRVCRIAGAKKTPIERFRPMWMNWSTVIQIEYDASNLNANEVVNLVSIAGAFVGVCEGRPEKCSLGWGRWEVV